MRDTGVRFSDIAGLDHIVMEMREIVKMLLGDALYKKVKMETLHRMTEMHDHINHWTQTFVCHSLHSHPIFGSLRCFVHTAVTHMPCCLAGGSQGPSGNHLPGPPRDREDLHGQGHRWGGGGGILQVIYR